MKALIKERAEPGIWMGELAEPTVGHNDVLIKINKTSICGTDIHIYKWDPWAQRSIKVPMAIGHEYSGAIVGMGSEVRGFSNRSSGLGKGVLGASQPSSSGERSETRGPSSRNCPTAANINRVR